MRVSDWISQHPDTVVTVPESAGLDEILSLLVDNVAMRDAYVVDEDGRVIGHLTHRRLAHMLLADQRPTHTRRQIMERIAGGAAGELMDRDFVYATPNEALDEVVHRQLTHDVEDMPVLKEDKRLLGAINLRAVLSELGRHGQRED